MASQHAPHWRGRSRRNSPTRTSIASAASAGMLPTGNSATWRRALPSCTSTVLRQASRWLALISPRYSTWRCTTRPSARRRFSTTFQYWWTLPSFLRRLQRKNMHRTLCAHPVRRKDQGLHYKRFAKTLLYASTAYEPFKGRFPGKQRRVEKDGLGVTASAAAPTALPVSLTAPTAALTASPAPVAATPTTAPATVTTAQPASIEVANRASARKSARERRDAVLRDIGGP